MFTDPYFYRNSPLHYMHRIQIEEATGEFHPKKSKNMKQIRAARKRRKKLKHKKRKAWDHL